MKGTRDLLNRISNLISDDSAVLKDFNNKIDKASADKTKAEAEKKSFENDIKNIQKDIDDITKASELTERFSNLDKYMAGLEKLGNACEYIKKINDELGRIPEHIEESENKIKDLTEKSDKSEKNIKEDEDELSKLDVEISDAKRYQSNLIELIELAKTGDINKTREEVVETLTHVGFNDQDAINAAKVILFPEDDLIPYFKKDDNHEVEEASEASIKSTEDDTEKVETKEIENVEDNTVDVPLEEDKEESLNVEEPEQAEESTNVISDINEEIEEPDQPDDEKKEDANDTLSEILSNNGLDINKFSPDSILSLKDASEDQITKNVDFLLDKNIDKEFIYQYAAVLTDTELEDKFNYLINDLGKNIDDIKINPVILISYSLADFKKLADIATKSGIDPKAIPLMVYIKGLQSFLQNYMTLKSANINLDDNELEKFGVILSIEPYEFKLSLQTIMSYNLSLKKNSGKYALMALLKPAAVLSHEIDMVIEIGEEDILKFYPEVLESDVTGLINRLLFIKKSGIPYKASAHGETVYQSYVLSQEKLEKIVEKKLDLHEMKNSSDTNNILNDKIQDENIINELGQMNFDDRLQSLGLDSCDTILKDHLKNVQETLNTYIIDNMYFSKNRVKENINYLLTNMDYSDSDKILLASFVYNTNLNEENINALIKALNVKVR